MITDEAYHLYNKMAWSCLHDQDDMSQGEDDHECGGLSLRMVVDSIGLTLGYGTGLRYYCDDHWEDYVQCFSSYSLS